MGQKSDGLDAFNLRGQKRCHVPSAAGSRHRICSIGQRWRDELAEVGEQHRAGVHEVETVVPWRRQARRSGKYVADGLDPLYRQVETLIAYDFKLKMGQHPQRIVKHDTQPSEVAREFEGGVPQKMKSVKCFR